MIKAVGRRADGVPLLLIGLSHENIARLVADEPISFDAADLGLPPMMIIVAAGRTEDELAAKLRVRHGGRRAGGRGQDPPTAAR
jgi:hypothetical protein